MKMSSGQNVAYILAIAGRNVINVFVQCHQAFTNAFASVMII
jgi:hypothetical protein